MKKYFLKLENYPIGICGTILGLITVANAWALNNITFLKPISIALAIFIISLMLIRLIIFPKKIISDLKNPVSGSFYPTIDMSLFLIASFFQKSSPILAKYIWLTAAILHFSLIILYSILRLKNKNSSEIIPSWFVVYVGLVTGSIASKGMGYDKLAKFMLFFGIAAFLILWPIMLYRIFTNKIDKDKVATCAIIAAPGSLALAGSITLFKNANPYFIMFLAFASLFNVLIAYFFALKLLKNAFKPAFATLTFPLAISALAIYKFSEYLSLNSYFTASNIFKVVGHIEIIIATAVIFYILFNFIILFFKSLKSASNSKELADNL